MFWSACLLCSGRSETLIHRKLVVFFQLSFPFRFTCLIHWGQIMIERYRPNWARRFIFIGSEVLQSWLNCRSWCSIIMTTIRVFLTWPAFAGRLLMETNCSCAIILASVIINLCRHGELLKSFGRSYICRAVDCRSLDDEMGSPFLRFCEEAV